MALRDGVHESKNGNSERSARKAAIQHQCASYGIHRRPRDSGLYPDLSNQGVYFYLASADEFPIDTDFDFEVGLPPEITLSTCCRIKCRGHAVRSEKSRNLTGIAAQILEYSIQREFTTAA